jgi:hypothetical protein
MRPGRWLAAAAIVAAGACASDEPPATGVDSASPPAPIAIHACRLVSANDALFTMGWQDIDNVDDPFESPVFDGTEEALSSACLYQPEPDDGTSFAAIGVFTPEHMASDFDDEVADGLELTGVGYDAWNVEQGVFVRQGDVGFLVVASSNPGSRDLPAAAELADTAVIKLANFETPAPKADPNVAACQLLTEEAAEASLDEADLTLDESHAYDDQRSDCEYATSDDSFRIIVYLSQGTAAREDFDSLKKGAIDADRYEKVEGLGDEAFSNGDIFVISGDAFLDVGIVVNEEERDLELETELARRLLNAVGG